MLDRRAYLLGQVLPNILANAKFVWESYPDANHKVRLHADLSLVDDYIDAAMQVVLAAEAALDAQDVIGQIETLAVGE